MAKFRYKMQSILDVKEKLENKAKQDFAQANARLDAEKVKLVELQKRRSYYMEEGLRLRLEKIDIRKIRENKMAVLKMDEYIKEIERIAAKCTAWYRLIWHPEKWKKPEVHCRL